MNGQIRIGVVGCGYWGKHYLRLFTELPQSRLVSACDQSIDALATVAGAYPEIAITPEFDNLCHRADIDAVVVSTQASTHYEITKKCLEAGKHVLVEKPLTTSSDHARELDTLAKDKGLVLMVGHTFIYNCAVQRLKRFVSDKNIGQLYNLYSRRTNLGPIRRDVSVVWDLATHDISIVDYLFDGPPTWVSAIGAQFLGSGRTDTAHITLGYHDGIVAHVHTSWADPWKCRELILVGSEMRVAFDDLDKDQPIRIVRGGARPKNGREMNSTATLGPVSQASAGYTPAPSEPLKNMSQHFLECIMTGRPPQSGGEDGGRIVQTLEAIDLSIRMGGSRVETLPRPYFYERQSKFYARSVG